ncbi:hypothetical protein GCM10011396_30730 [Undibacterium terreum]|uniref:Uncharacterized protein n=1 Tax=Undibacterium terreum TaxID=1224302 RepID=A0A916URC1_9BURK|nr:hypothetical protein GCM10011396_30730 [Undibacterium terreum]
MVGAMHRLSGPDRQARPKTVTAISPDRHADDDCAFAIADQPIGKVNEKHLLGELIVRSYKLLSMRAAAFAAHNAPAQCVTCINVLCLKGR